MAKMRIWDFFADPGFFFESGSGTVFEILNRDFFSSNPDPGFFFFISGSGIFLLIQDFFNPDPGFFLKKNPDPEFSPKMVGSINRLSKDLVRVRI